MSEPFIHEVQILVYSGTLSKYPIREGKAEQKGFEFIEGQLGIQIR